MIAHSIYGADIDVNTDEIPAEEELLPNNDSEDTIKKVLSNGPLSDFNSDNSKFILSMLPPKCKEELMLHDLFNPTSTSKPNEALNTAALQPSTESSKLENKVEIQPESGSSNIVPVEDIEEEIPQIEIQSTQATQINEDLKNYQFRLKWLRNPYVPPKSELQTEPSYSNFIQNYPYLYYTLNPDSYKQANQEIPNNNVNSQLSEVIKIGNGSPTVTYKPVLNYVPTTPLPPVTEPSTPRITPLAPGEPLYNAQLRFVVPVVMPSDQKTLSDYPWGIDPYAYFPPNMRPSHVQVPIPYKPIYHMIRTLTYQNKY